MCDDNPSEQFVQRTRQSSQTYLTTNQTYAKEDFLIYRLSANDGMEPPIMTNDVKHLRCLRLYQAEPKTELETDERCNRGCH